MASVDFKIIITNVLTNMCIVLFYLCSEVVMRNMMNKVAVPKEIMERIEFAVLAKGYSAHKTAQWIEFLFPNQYSFLEVMGIADSVKIKSEMERNAS